MKISMRLILAGHCPLSPVEDLMLEQQMQGTYSCMAEFESLRPIPQDAKSYFSCIIKVMEAYRGCYTPKLGSPRVQHPLICSSLRARPALRCPQSRFAVHCKSVNKESAQGGSRNTG